MRYFEIYNSNNHVVNTVGAKNMTDCIRQHAIHLHKGGFLLRYGTYTGKKAIIYVYTNDIQQSLTGIYTIKRKDIP